MHENQNGHITLGLGLEKLIRSWSLRVLEASEDNNRETVKFCLSSKTENFYMSVEPISKLESTDRKEEKGTSGALH